MTCDICEKQKASRIILSINYCEACYSDYLAAIKRANSPYIVKEEAGRIKTVHFPDSKFTMSFKNMAYLSDNECIQCAIEQKKSVENSPLRGSGKDEREEMNSD